VFVALCGTLYVCAHSYVEINTAADSIEKERERVCINIIKKYQDHKTSRVQSRAPNIERESGSENLLCSMRLFYEHTRTE